MTLNGVIVLILRYFTAFQAYYVTVVEDRLLMSAEYRLPLLAKLTYPAARSLCDSWASYLYCSMWCTFYSTQEQQQYVRFL